MKCKFPIVSIIMPTLNSGRTIKSALESIKCQNYPKNKIEILVVDGGSIDQTKEIALKYGAKIINNVKTQQEYAKHLGLNEAKGKYVCFLDSDEVLKNKKSIYNKVFAIEENSDSKFVVFSGYVKPKNYSGINDYINLFSDPFAFFIYGLSTDYRYYVKELSGRYELTRSNSKYRVLKIGINKAYPLIDLCAGNLFNVEYVRKILGKKINDPMIIPNLFELVVKSNNKFIIMNYDPIVHFSADSLKKYIYKLHWRILVNTHYKNIPGTGFVNREYSQPLYIRIKKYLFIVYAFSLVFPLIDSIRVYLKSRSTVAIIHPVLTLYVALDIVFQVILSLVCIKPRLLAYGNQNTKLNL